MQFQGERTIKAPLDTLYSRLADAEFLVACIPDASPTGPATADTAMCSVRPNFSFARGSLDVVITVTSRQPNAASKFLLASKGIGSSADVEASLAFTPEGETTKIIWAATIVKLGGLLKMVPAGLIRGAAQKVIDDVWAGIEVKFAEG